MFDLGFRSRALCCQLFWPLAALAFTSVAQAEIAIRDGGADGIFLSNLDTGDSAPALAKTAATGATPSPVRGDTALLRREKLAPLVAAAARTHGLPEALLQAVIEVESNFNASAVS